MNIDKLGNPIEIGDICVVQEKDEVRLVKTLKHTYSGIKFVHIDVEKKTNKKPLV